MNRYAAIALSGAAAAGLAVVLAVQVAREDESLAPPPAGPDAVRMASSPEIAETPVFDVVRVAPNGDVVIAGRARPNAELVIVRLGDTQEPSELGRALADMRGEWVFVPDLPVEPGPLRLVAEIRRPDGTVVRSQASAPMEVPVRERKQEVSAPAR